MSRNPFRDFAEKIRARRRQKAERPVLSLQRVKDLTGDFICDRHWAQVEAANADPFTVVLGCSTWLYLNGYPLEPAHGACCMMQKLAFTGVVQRAKLPKEPDAEAFAQAS